MPTKTELAARVAELETQVAHLSEGAKVLTPSEAELQVRSALRGYDTVSQEHFVVMCFDSRSKLLASRVVAIGTVNTVEVHPRDVFREAVRMNATFVVVAHNHPSGDLGASEADIELTERLRRSGEVLGLPLLDHIIVAHSGSLSMASAGFI